MEWRETFIQNVVMSPKNEKLDQNVPSAYELKHFLSFSRHFKRKNGISHVLKNGWSEKKRFAADTVWFFGFYNVKKHPKKCIFCYFLSKISVVYQFKKLSDKQFDTKVIVRFILVGKTKIQKITLSEKMRI